MNPQLSRYECGDGLNSHSGYSSASHGKSRVLVSGGRFVTNVLQCVGEAGELVGSGRGDGLANVEEADVADVVADGQVMPRRRPTEFIQGDVVGGSDRSRRHFRVPVQIPQVQSARDVDAGEQRRVNRTPSYVQNVIGEILEGMEERAAVGADRTQLIALRTPQFDSPIAGRSEE